MTFSLGPNQGFYKPTIRPVLKLRYGPMAKGLTRRRKIAGKLRAVIAANVKARAAVQFKTHPNVPIAIKDASGGAFSKSTVQRIMGGKVGTSLEQLEALGRALDIAPYQLLMENFDARNPQVAKGAMLGEEAVYAIRKAVREELEDSKTRPKIGKLTPQEVK